MLNITSKFLLAVMFVIQLTTNTPCKLLENLFGKHVNKMYRSFKGPTNALGLTPTN